MRKIIIGLLLLLSFGASAQWQQTGSKVRYVNGLGIPTKDTAAGVSADSSQILIRPADSSLYIKYKRTWVKVGAGGGGTIGGSGTINYVPKFTSASTIGNSIMYDSAGVTYVKGYISVDPFTPVSPLSIIQVGSKNTLTSSDAKILVNNYYTNTTAANGHAFADNSDLQKNSGAWAYASYDGRVGISGTGVSADHYVSFQAAPTYTFTGTMLYNYGTYTTHFISSGTITNNYAHYVANPVKTGSGAITNNYALYIANQTAGTNNYSIYSAGGSNYLAGGLQVLGTINADNTTANLRLKGGGTGTTDAGVYINSTGNMFFSDWDATRGFASVSGGNGYYFGGNFGVGYTAPVAKLAVNGTTLINTNTDNGVDKLQVSGSAIASTLKVNTSGQTVSISSYYNTGGGRNIWIGGGGLSSTSADESTAIGFESMLSNTSGYYNTAVGSQSLRLNTSGYYNMAFGMQALASNTSGYKNTAIGVQSLGSNTTGNDNLGIGAQVLQSHATGNKNNGIGSTSLFYLTSGSSNIALGYYAGIYINGGSNHTNANQSIFIGEDTRPSANGNTNEIVIGHNAIGQGSNTVTLGNSSITKTFLRGNTMVNTTTDNGVDELQVNGSISGIGFKQAYVTKTGAYTATNDDYVIDCTSGTFTVTLPASSGRTGRILIIKNSGAGTITVDGNASETIDGASTYAISVQYGTIQIMSDGTNWKIIAKF